MTRFGLDVLDAAEVSQRVAEQGFSPAETPQQNELKSPELRGDIAVASQVRQAPQAGGTYFDYQVPQEEIYGGLVEYMPAEAVQDARQGRSTFAQDAGLGISTIQPTMAGMQPTMAGTQPEQDSVQQPAIPSLANLHSEDYYTGEEDSILPPSADELPETPAPTSWTQSAGQIGGAPWSSYSLPVADAADLEQSRSSDKWTREHYTNRTEMRELQAQAREEADAALKQGRYGYEVPDLGEEADQGVDQWREKQGTDFSDLPSSNRLSRSAVDSTKNQYLATLSGDDVGGKVWDKLMPDERLRLDEVAIGISDLEAILEQDPSHFDELLKNMFPDGASNHDLVQIVYSINQAAKLRNGYEIYVALSKPPDVRISDAQQMILRIESDNPRGIFIHPIIAPLFNADFDGDDAHLSLSQKMAKLLRNTIDLLIDPDGTTHIDDKWFPVQKIVDNALDGVSRRDFVRDIMFNEEPVSDQVIDAVLKLGDDPNPDNKNKNLVYLIRALRAYVGNDNRRLCDLLMSTYKTFQRLSRKVMADAVGTYVDSPVEPRTDGDRIILSFVDDFVKGRIPANWYDFKRAFNSFVGDIRSGNSDFRVSASVAKLFKLDNSLVIGGEYKIDLGNGKQVDTFLEATMAYASAMRQSHEEKQAGRSYSHTRQLRENVIRRVGFPDSYENTAMWLHEFIKVYRVESALENEANLIVKNNMQISQASQRNVVATINPTGSRHRVTYGDIAESIVDVYGDVMFNRIFQHLEYRQEQVLSDKDVEQGWKPRDVWQISGKGYATKELYMGYSVRRFSKDNHVIYNRRQQEGMNSCIIPVRDETTGMWTVEEYGKVKKKDGSISYEVTSKQLPGISDNVVEMMLMKAIADQKTSSESAYATRVYGKVDQKNRVVRPTFKHSKSYQNAQERKNEQTGKYYEDDGGGSSSQGIHKTLMNMRFDLIQQMKEAKSRDTHDSRVEFRDLLRTMMSSGSELFAYFGMDSETGWNASIFSKAMMEAKNADQMGGVNMTMHYAMRTNQMFAARKALDAYREAPGMSEMEAQTMNEIAFMEQELASASQTWEAIVLEMRTGEGWRALQEKAKDMAANPDKYKSRNEYLEAAWYWENPLHSNVDEMMRDSLLGFVEKRDILCDLVRCITGDSTFMSYEVCYQLEVGSGGEWSLKSDGQKQLFETYNDFERQFNQYNDISHQNMTANIEEAYQRFGDKKGALMGAIHNLAMHPGLLYKIGFDTMADAVCSTMERLYEQSEKNSTHPWANSGYQLLSHQYNGGYFNELYRTDDLVVGSQNIKYLNVSDFVMMLDDPDFKLTGYNDIGQIVQVDRASLLGFKPGESYDVERELWRFLRDNPRLAGCLRMQTGAVSVTSEGKAYTVAACDTTETIERSFGENGETILNPLDDMAYLMFDHPGFHAIASLCTPAAGSKASHRSPKIEATEKYLCYLIYQNATDNRFSAARNAERILKSLGITRATLRENLVSEFEGMVRAAGIEERQEAIDEREAVVSGRMADNKILMYGMYDNCLNFMTNYLTEVAEAAESGMIDLKTGIKNINRPDHISVDKSSIHSFYDVIQELSGAKTDVSTGIEGSETFQFGMWSSLIAAKDRYASLDAILDEIEGDPEVCETFNGAITNAGPVVVENGRVVNIDELREASGSDELVVLCPDSYEVGDWMIDSQGRFVPSQKSLMMSKRSDGTEGHNLQVMKTGIDGLDSIVKVKSKYFFEGKGKDRKRIDYDMRVQIIRDAASKGATEEEQMFLARLSLARELLKSNIELKYDKWTLANYMCIADLMLIRGDDGEIYLRSLEQIYTALKHRLGVYGNDMSNDQRKRKAMEIVNDTSEFGCIGRTTTSPTGAFDAMRPSRVSPSTRGMYPYLSERSVNRELLDEIVSHLPGDEYAWSDLKREQVEERLRGKHKWLGGVLKKSFILRQYHVVGCLDSDRHDELHEAGMSSLFVIGTSATRSMSNKEIYDVMNRCWKHGETIMIPASAMREGRIHPGYMREAMPCVTKDDGEPTWYMINTFHMRLNGSEAKPYKATYAQAQYPYEKDWFFAEDTFGEFDYGDSGGLLTRNGHDKVSHSSQPVNVQINVNEMFAQQFKTLGKNGRIDISFVDQITLDGFLNHTIPIEIDPGVVRGAEGWARRTSDIDAAIERYQQKTDNGDGMILNQDCHAGDIVGWALAKVRDGDGNIRYAIAPIIPYSLHDAKRVMDTFQVTDITFKDGDHNNIVITMKNTTEIEGYAKMHLPSSGADKVMMNLSNTIDDDGMSRTLMDGTVIDSYVDYRTTMSRRIGTLSRLRTMETMVRMARMNGYNFANAPGAFPEADANAPVGTKEYNAAAIKEALKRYPPPSQNDWRMVIKTIRFHTDPLIDTFCRFSCKKCLDDGGNPSHFLASEFIDPTVDQNNPINSMFQWEYLASFENNLTYEDAFLKFFHLMNPHGKFNGNFCPNGLDDSSSDCLFRLKQDRDGRLADGYDLGVLQMKVPHRFEDFDGSKKWVYIWECVFSGTGFFGEDFSMGSRPNIEGSSLMSDTMNMIGSMDFDLSEEDNRLRYGWSIADMGALPMTGSAVIGQETKD